MTPQDILEKEFKIDTRGYRLKEVDSFLDTIIGDYEQFLNIINSLEKEKADLLSEIMKLKQELRTAKTNVDLLKRISQLEKAVFGEKE